MKAVVLEIKENWAAVLCEDGVVRKIKKGKLSVGDSLDISLEDILPAALRHYCCLPPEQVEYTPITPFGHAPMCPWI